MNDLIVIDNELSRFGLRNLHLMRMGQRVDLDEARADFLPPGVEEVMKCEWEEGSLGAWHLVLSWPARELVQLQENGNFSDAVMWWVGAKSWMVEGKPTLREAADLAAMLFQLRTGRAPCQVLVRHLPQNATQRIVTDAGELQLVEMGWIPAGFVVIQ